MTTTVRLLVGDDWAEDHHDVEFQGADGRVLGRARLAEGVAGIARFHVLVDQAMAGLGIDIDEADRVEVQIGIETDRGPWVQALIAAGYRVFAINPLQVARYRQRCSVSGAKSDTADAHTLADMVRTDAHQLRGVAGDSALAAAVKVVARGHKTLIWERTRHAQRLRHALREYFPAALEVAEILGGVDASDMRALLAKAADPVSAARLSISQITTVLKRARRHHVAEKAARIQAILRAEQLAQPAVVASAYAATTRATIGVLDAICEQVAVMEGHVDAYFGQHPDAEIVRSQPGLGMVLGARVLAEFGDDPLRYASAKARKNYAGTSPITRQSGKKRAVMARYVHNDRLVDALCWQAFNALRTSPGARAYYDQLRARGAGHRAALRQLANRLVGILHGCLKTRTLYNEHTAWSHHETTQAA